MEGKLNSSWFGAAVALVACSLALHARAQIYTWNLNDHHTDSVGQIRADGRFYLDLNRNLWDGTHDDVRPPAPDVWNLINTTPFAGDFDNTKIDQVGSAHCEYTPATGTFEVWFFLDSDPSTPGVPDEVFMLEGAECLDIPIAGDWNGDGCTGLGTWRPSDRRFRLWNRVPAPGGGCETVPGPPTTVTEPWMAITCICGPWGCACADPGPETPIVGDWNGDCVDDLGLHALNSNPLLTPSGFQLDRDGDRNFDETTDDKFLFPFPRRGVPVAGDWNGDGSDQLGVFGDDARFYVDINGNRQWDEPDPIGDPDIDPWHRQYDGKDFASGVWGSPSDRPVIGNWAGKRKTCEGESSRDCSTNPRWCQILADAGITPGTGPMAPAGPKWMGPVWSQWLGSAETIAAMYEYVNITEIGIRTKAFNNHFKGIPDTEDDWSVEEILMQTPMVSTDGPAHFIFEKGPNRSAPPPLSIWDALMVAKAIGVHVLVTIDSSCDSKSYHRCDDPYWSAATGGHRVVDDGTPLPDADIPPSPHRNNMHRIYLRLLSYLRDNFPNVSHVQIENEPCFETFKQDMMHSEYTDLVSDVTPIIRHVNPSLKIIVGDTTPPDPGDDSVCAMANDGACGTAAADPALGLDFDILGVHAALPRDAACDNARFSEEVRQAVQSMIAMYGDDYEIWIDEIGVGEYEPTRSYTDLHEIEGAERMFGETGVIHTAFEEGADGMLFLSLGGLEPKEVLWDPDMIAAPLRYSVFYQDGGFKPSPPGDNYCAACSSGDHDNCAPCYLQNLAGWHGISR